MNAPAKKRPVKQDETIYITDEPSEENTPVPLLATRPAKKNETISITDGQIEEDDSLYNTKKPSSVRRYHVPPTPAQTRTIMRVTRHSGGPVTPRASLKAQQPQPQIKQKPAKQKSTSFRPHWLLYVGGGMIASMALWIVGSTAVSFAQTVHDNLTYGTPRTYQIDANVGHQGTSHFIVENLQGDILVLELHPSSLAATKVYQGPQFSGPGADDYVATIEFKDLGNGKPDMIIAVNNQRFVLVNDGTGFRPVTSSDHIDQQEVN